MQRHTVLAAAFILGLVLWMPSAEAQEISLAEAGYGHFVEHCASCHGSVGKGDGPVAADLTTPPADLTRITERHGSFPEPLLVEIIDGRRRVRGHGSRAMPVWGREFSRQSSETGEDLVIRGRIRLLVEYLRSIQTK